MFDIVFRFFKGLIAALAFTLSQNTVTVLASADQPSQVTILLSFDATNQAKVDAALSGATLVSATDHTLTYLDNPARSFYRTNGGVVYAPEYLCVDDQGTAGVSLIYGTMYTDPTTGRQYTTSTSTAIASSSTLFPVTDKLGYTAKTVITTHQTMYTLGQFSIGRDTLSGLGVFVRIGINDIQGLNKIMLLLGSWGITAMTQYTISNYLNLMLNPGWQTNSACAGFVQTVSVS